MPLHTITKEIAGRQITLSTGKLALRSAGAVLVQVGGTSLLATADIDTRETELDYFPLSVEYIEKMYASGQIPGSRFVKSEGYPSDEAVTKARQVDHSIRSLFPKGFKRAVSVILTVLSYDGVNSPEALTVLGASAALSISGAPYFGPSASVVMGLTKDQKVIINPSHSEEESLLAEYAFSGTSEKLLSIEGWSDELSEDGLFKLIDEAHEVIKALNELQTEFAKPVAKPILPYSELPADEALINQIKAEKYDAIKTALFTPERDMRDDSIRSIKQELIAARPADSTNTDMDIDKAVEYVARWILRESILKDGKRIDGRGLQEIRPLSAEIDLLPTVHGSALFARGLTQALSIVALGSKTRNQIVDGMEGEYEKGFMHQYNMPEFSTGGVGRYKYRPSRREVGHGAIGENGLKKMIPSQDDFPYAIRVVSEVMTSNGSTSMASTCAASMALMAAGVPMKRPVGGIGVGLVTVDGNEDDYRLLLDIQGIEDFYGDMDFKITGTTEGITAIQYENKLRGVNPKVLKEAINLSRTGRLQVLEVMGKAIATSREDLPANAPRVVVVNINPESIGELIGPSGKNIKGILESVKNQAEVDIQDDGRVFISAKDGAVLAAVTEAIKASTQEAVLNEVYTGVIDSVVDFGAFVNVTPKITGLIHVSEMSDGYVKNPSEIVTKGQTVKVKLIKSERGKLSFTMKGLNQTV